MQRSMARAPHLTSDELPIPAVILGRHEVLHDVDEQPEGVLLVHEEERYRHDTIETLEWKEM